MNILILTGSYRRNGNTDQITGLIKEHLESEARQRQSPLAVETISLGQQNLQFCRGCRVCYDRGEDLCPVKDDVAAIKAKMLEADGVLFASPVYVDDASGMMKTLIDRLCHVCHRPQFAGKVAYLAATTGSSRTGKTLETMRMAAQVWGFHVAGQAGFAMGALMKREETKERFDKQAARAAQALFRAIEQKQFRNPSFLSLMMFAIQQRAWQDKAVDGTLDQRYWKEQGWFDRGATFYFEHEASRVKVMLARAVGTVVGKIMA